MLGDVELFILSWILAAAAFILFATQLYVDGRINQIREGKIALETDQSITLQKLGRVPYVTFPTFVVLNAIGMIVDLVNWIPVTEWSEGTEFFRVFRIHFAFYGVLLALGIIWLILFRLSTTNDLDNEKNNEKE
ncbi:MAG: hypothetical protein ACW98Y_12180 [Candidatus Thorarchaeota archaeon]|jgi:hypothetical protein